MKPSNMIMYGIYLLCIILIIKAVRKDFFTPLVTIEDYFKRAKHFEIYFKNRRKAINVLEKALKEDKFSISEKNQLKLRIGILYNYKKEYENAKKYFDEILDYVRKTKLPYDKELSAIVVVYYNLGDKDTARKVYHWLRAKEKYDPLFELLSYLDAYIFK